MNHPQGRSPEVLFAEFLERRDSLDFEVWVGLHPEQSDELRRLHLEAIKNGTIGRMLGEMARRGTVFYSPPVQLDEAARQSDLSEGMVVAGYELIRRLGGGGMGEVWQAHQVSVDRDVALKFIRTDHIGERVVRRFLVEGRAGARLNHPNLVAVYDTGDDDGRYWLAQELVPGGCTLRGVIDDFHDRQKLPPRYDRYVAELFLEIAEALEAAHEAGVVHRDIKPQNILVTPEDRPKIGDFGLARLMDDGMSTEIGLEGTPYYMSPEQAAAKTIGVDARSDVFSLGAVLYEMLTFQRPFDGDTNAQILARILHVDPADPRKLRGVPEELAVIVMGALEKRREDRYQTMSELAEDLRRYLKDQPILRKPPGPVLRVRKWTRRHPTASVAIALGALLLGTVAVLGPEAVLQRNRAEASEKKRLYVELRWAIDRGELQEAQAHADAAEALDPDDPRGHVYLASGFAQFGRYEDAEREVELALMKGFSGQAPVDGTAEEHLTFGLFVSATKKSRGWEEAREHLERALELDPELKGALYPLHQVCIALGDSADAREYLERYRLQLAPADDLFPLVEALLTELDGDAKGAVDQLLASDPPEETRIPLRHYRNLGRLQINAGDLEGAEASLRAHLEGMPEDGVASLFLAEALARQYYAEPEAADAETLAEIEQALERSLAWDPAWVKPIALRVNLALIELGRDRDLYESLPPDLEQEARRRIAALRDRDSEHADLPRFEAQLLFLEALPAVDDGREDEGIELLETSVEHDPDHVLARVLLAQQLFETETEMALEHLERAWDAWERDTLRAHSWKIAIHVWTFGAAARLGEIDIATDARAEAELAIDEGTEGAEEELISYAEFLAEPGADALRDCERARAVIEDFDLEALFRDNEQADEIFARIEAACR